MDKPSAETALLYVSFGGPEGNEDVMPFLENITRGRRIPRERLLEVAEHYYHFGGKSPINDQNRRVISALQKELLRRDISLPIYFGNRNWEPFVTDALEAMQKDGHESALAFFTSVFSCYSGCRQYRENICAAQEQLGRSAPRIAKVRNFHNHPGYIAAVVDRVRVALAELSEYQAETIEIVFTAHSIPLPMAEKSAYAQQFQYSSSLVMESFDSRYNWRIAYQSRSGAPGSPWLEPDILDVLRTLHDEGKKAVVVVPIGFVSDHVEVLHDLDREAKESAAELGLGWARALAVGDHPEYIRMIADLIEERIFNKPERPVLGSCGAMPDVCPENCCLAGERG